MKYTIEEFRKEYPNDATCLDKIFAVRFGSLKKVCPHCGEDTEFRRIPTRRSYQCRLCYFQIYPCANTPFQKTRTPLNYWFYVMYLMTTTRNGISAKEVQRVLGVTYKTAFKMNQQIRVLMGMQPRSKSKLKGFVEMDETYVGGKVSNRKDKFEIPKSPVFAMVERLGEVKAIKVLNARAEQLLPLVIQNVEPTAMISTDENVIYKNLPKMGFEEHSYIKHSMNQYKDGQTCTNTVEGFFSQLKRMIYGTHIHVSSQHLQKYVDEACFRYNNRFKDTPMFDNLLLKFTLCTENE